MRERPALLVERALEARIEHLVAGGLRQICQTPEGSLEAAKQEGKPAAPGGILDVGADLRQQPGEGKSCIEGFRASTLFFEQRLAISGIPLDTLQGGLSLGHGAGDLLGNLGGTETMGVSDAGV